MLAGLLFAVRDAEDRPDRLAATLPFAGTTLIEYQARLLVAAGVSQLVVLVARLTPDLLGALGRIGKRGVTVDAVRTAAEAAQKLHPLSRLVVMADGLVTTEGVLRQLACEGTDTLLVVGEQDADPALELIGGRLAWAGVARLGYLRLREVAAMPRDYDLQSALLRAASQAGAAHLMLPATAAAEGHGVEHRGAALEARGRSVLASMASDASGWFDRWIVAPVARIALPALVSRGVGPGALGGAGGAIGLIGLAAIWFDAPAVGIGLALIGVVALSMGAVLARLRDEQGSARTQFLTAAALPAFSALLFGARLSAASGQATELVIAIGFVVAAALGERAITGPQRRLFWGGPGAYLAILFAGAVAGVGVWVLAAVAGYAAATLGAAIEALRRDA
jgi:hypothetical protein